MEGDEMTDDRAPEGQPNPGMSGVPSEPTPTEPVPAAEPPASAPPPLAPYVSPASTPATAGPTAQPAVPAAPQPAAAWAPPSATVATGPAPRSTLSLIAGILLLIGGILGGLAGLAVAVVGSAVIGSLGDLGTFPQGIDVATFASGLITFVGIIIFLYSLAYLFAGVGVIRSRDWGRVLGLVVSIISGLIWLGSVATPDQAGARDSIFGSLIAFAIHAYIIVALLFFWRSKAAAA
jgi:hypothetical protein